MLHVGLMTGICDSESTRAMPVIVSTRTEVITFLKEKMPYSIMHGKHACSHSLHVLRTTTTTKKLL